MTDLTTLVGFSAAAFLVATVVTMTGFGLGTSLTPIFALVYQTHIAVMLVAVVHFLNNVFRLGLFRRHVDFTLIKRFGVLSIAGALVGALLQGTIQSDWLKVLLGVVLIVIGGIELAPGGSGWRFPPRFDQVGGLLSGLVGGLLGNQGAVRSAYLVNYNIPKESFIATATLIAIFIDSTRLPIYFLTQWDGIVGAWPLLLSVTICAYAGTYVGSKLVGRVSQAAFKRLVNAMVVFLGVVMIIQGAWQTAGMAAAFMAGAATVAVLSAAYLGFHSYRRQSRRAA
ncbi:MAG: sulfite exporter TauE/SafE family protein [Chloroflexi bacterium]|nr:sulfite exporter TauE/SafE family protein [Chloroflexota bacterium]